MRAQVEWQAKLDTGGFFIVKLEYACAVRLSSDHAMYERYAFHFRLGQMIKEKRERVCFDHHAAISGFCRRPVSPQLPK